MKKIFLLVWLCSSLHTIAQEAVLLRMNYTLSDQYILELQQSQDVSINDVSVSKTLSNSTLQYTVAEKDSVGYILQLRYNKLTMDMDQGGQKVTYDSSQPIDENNATAVFLKNQLSPILSSTMYVSISPLGENKVVKVEPEVEGLDAMNNNVFMTYPKEEVKVGSSWSFEQDNAGITIKSNYTVEKIENGSVFLGIKGTIEGMGTGTLQGSMVIDIESGIQKESTVEMEFSVEGAKSKISTSIKMSKI